jgi:hypothetical protein
MREACALKHLALHTEKFCGLWTAFLQVAWSIQLKISLMTNGGRSVTGRDGHRFGNSHGFRT